MEFSELPRDVRGALRGLSKDNAHDVGRHLIMVARLLDADPELAYEHAQEAVRRAGRIDVVREAAGIAAYRTGRYAEALRELRTVRRLNGSSEHLPLMADCERGLGRSARALDLAASDEASTLDPDGRAELAMVASGARLDLDEVEAAGATLDMLDLTGVSPEVQARVKQARADIYIASGRSDLAAELLATVDRRLLAATNGNDDDDDEDVVVYDLANEVIDGEPIDGEPIDGEPIDDDSAAEHSDDEGDVADAVVESDEAETNDGKDA